jgi:hypothetical protein
MTVVYGRAVLEPLGLDLNNSNKDGKRIKSGIINVTKVAARKSILMQTTRAKAASLFD